jgi:hypothetical protein
MKKIFILLLFIITSCGYQSLYKIDEQKEQIKISDVEIIGNKKIGKKIYSILPVIINKNNESLNKLILNSKKDVNETSKNSKGQVISYRTSISVQLSFLDNKNNLIKEKNFVREFLYNTKTNKFKFKEYQVEVENNLIDRIKEDIFVYLNY